MATDCRSRFPPGSRGAVDLADLHRDRRHLNEAAIRSQCRGIYLGDHTVLCWVLGRYRMYVDTTDLGLGSHLMTLGYWEMWHSEAVMQLVKPGMTAVDVGANLGYFTLMMAELVGPAGQVHAFEPNPEIAEKLRNSLYLNGFLSRTTIHRLALGEVDGKAALIVPANEPKNGYVVPARTDGSGTGIETRRLDGVPGLLDADFIKIDVEGAEEDVWRGMAGLLKSPRSLTIILEFTANRYADPAGFLDEILSYGFALSVIDHVNGIVTIDRQTLLAQPEDEDQLLVLRR